MGYRHERLQDEVRRLMGSILSTQTQDPRLKMVSVTRVALSRDLSVAKVYVSQLGGEEEGQRTVAVLEGARGYLRSLLAGSLRIKRVPHLEFRYDPSMADAARIHDLLDGRAGSTRS